MNDTPYLHCLRSFPAIHSFLATELYAIRRSYSLLCHLEQIDQA
jgi:hypothetical protein